MNTKLRGETTRRSAAKNQKNTAVLRTVHYAISKSSLGHVLVAASENGVCSIILADSSGQLLRDLRHQFPKAKIVSDKKEVGEWIEPVLRYIKKPRLGLNLRLHLRGTPFQQRVWQALREIPCGTTKTYSQIAGELGIPKSVRAVARAIASNNIALAVPCHRVIRASGDLCGYRWGPKRKQKLLAAECRKQSLMKK